MDTEMRSAAMPRWRGDAGRLEVWYATLSDPATGAGLWVHYETVAPTVGAAYGHGWVSWFPTDVRRRLSASVPNRSRPVPGPDLAAGRRLRVGPAELCGRAGSLGWDLRWKDTGRPLWTFPRVAWAAPAAGPGARWCWPPPRSSPGSITLGDTVHQLDGWRGGVAHIYGRGNAKRWGWIHADLGDSDVLEVVTAVSHTPGLRRLPPMAFIRFRIDGADWPTGVLPSLRMRTTLGLRHWQLEGRIGRRDTLIRVDMPAERCVSLQYTDPDGATAVCTNTERADVYVELGERRWSVLGTGHAEVGLRGSAAPVVREGISS
ncbi:hypothetical protein H7I76_11655 [Mycolicibacterium vaccae]|nr:hypothetical protein [Mycolicibacterium vaccae]